MTDLRLVIFDVDGTLVDSRGMVLAAMRAAYGALGAPMPADDTLMRQVGRSLDLIFPEVSPELDARDHAALAAGYRDAFQQLRTLGRGENHSPLFPGAAAALAALAGQSATLLGIATGKSRRGWRVLDDMHGWGRLFQTVQTADDHPSKPHPSMIAACLTETGVARERAVMIGDTSFDIDMGRAAGVATIAVPWGNHPPDMLDADALIGDFADLPATIDALIGPER